MTRPFCPDVVTRAGGNEWTSAPTNCVGYASGTDWVAGLRCSERLHPWTDTWAAVTPWQHCNWDSNFAHAPSNGKANASHAAFKKYTMTSNDECVLTVNTLKAINVLSSVFFPLDVR